MDLFNKKRVAQLEDSLATQTRIFDILQEDWCTMEARYDSLTKQLAINSLALARVIAKIDPTYAQDEFDPKRKETSNALGEEVIRRLSSEEYFSNRNRG